MLNISSQITINVGFCELCKKLAIHNKPFCMQSPAAVTLSPGIISLLEYFGPCYCFPSPTAILTTVNTFLLPLFESQIVIVIVNSKFLKCPQKWSHGHQLIHSRLIRTKSIGSAVQIQDTSRRWDGYGCWFRIEMARESGWRGRIRIGFTKEQCFQCSTNLWKDSKRWGFGELVG